MNNGKYGPNGKEASRIMAPRPSVDAMAIEDPLVQGTRTGIHEDLNELMHVRKGV